MAEETSDMAGEQQAAAGREQRAAEARTYLRGATGATVTPAMENAGAALLERITADTEQRAADAAEGGSVA